MHIYILFQTIIAELETFKSLPFATPDGESNLRDNMLKTEPDIPNAVPVAPNQKVDTDLDGK